MFYFLRRSHQTAGKLTYNFMFRGNKELLERFASGFLLFSLMYSRFSLLHIIVPLWTSTFSRLSPAFLRLSCECLSRTCLVVSLLASTLGGRPNSTCTRRFPLGCILFPSFHKVLKKFLHRYLKLTLNFE